MTTIIKERCSECYGWIEFVGDEVGWIHFSPQDEETCGLSEEIQRVMFPHRFEVIE